MPVNPISPIAQQIPKLRTFRLRNGKKTVWRRVSRRHGATIHISGNDPFKFKQGPDYGALNLYTRERANLGQYLVLREELPASPFRDVVRAKVMQLVADDLCCAHAGVDPWQYQAYRDGSWREPKLSDAARKLFDAAKRKDPTLRLWPQPSPVAVATWDARWKALGFQHPGQLGPALSNNEDYIGIEVVGDEKNGITPAQHVALRALLEDIAHRWGLTDVLWSEPGRLVGHSDLDIYERWTRSGKPWDPGPTLDWSLLGPSNVGVDVERALAAMRAVMPW